MRTTHRALVLAVLTLVAVPWRGAAQTTVAAAATAAPATTAPAAAAWSAAEMETFLVKGQIVKKKESSKGVTDAFRVTLSDGARTHDAQVQNVDISKPFFEVDPKHTEVNFKDSYKYNVAAYRLSVLLGLDNVPMSVERVVEGKPSAVTWWLDNVMDEGDRVKKQVPNSNPMRAAEYYSVMYVFDELIQNRDRNRGNIMWSPDSKMWMIDHTRSFRLGKDLQKAENLTRIERTLLEKLRSLDQATLTQSMGKILTKGEIEALFTRRDKIVQLFDQKIASLGEAKVLYTIR
jgi:hypothetical protein